MSRGTIRGIAARRLLKRRRPAKCIGAFTDRSDHEPALGKGIYGAALMARRELQLSREGCQLL